MFFFGRQSRPKESSFFGYEPTKQTTQKFRVFGRLGMDGVDGVFTKQPVLVRYSGWNLEAKQTQPVVVTSFGSISFRSPRVCGEDHEGNLSCR